jgi:hypothetical protein
MTDRMRAPAHITALAALAALAGCQNETNSLTHAEPGALPDLREATTSSDRAMTATGPVDLDGRPLTGPATGTTTTLDRSGWAPMAVNQPRGQVEVQPWYYKRFEGFGTGPRTTGAYPTTATALGTRDGAGSVAQEWISAPAIGIFWIAATPAQVLVLPPLDTVRAPDRDVEWLPTAKAPAAR